MPNELTEQKAENMRCVWNLQGKYVVCENCLRDCWVNRIIGVAKNANGNYK